MENIAVVTDSTSDLPQLTAVAHGITIVPLSVIHQGVVYQDGIDITPDKFYPMLTATDELPKTSQPTPQQFKDLYERLLESSEEILSIHISGALSSTADVARSAAESLAKDRIHVVDSGFLSYGLAFQALEAARLAQEGRSIQEILSRVSRLKEKTELLFTLETLHYLYKGGRIGKVSSLMGSLLGIKPVIRVENGAYVAAGRTRSIKQALKAIGDFLASTYRRQKVVVAVGHGQARDRALMLSEMLGSVLNIAVEPAFFEVGPVIGVHTGPGTVGVAVRPLEY